MRTLLGVQGTDSKEFKKFDEEMQGIFGSLVDWGQRPPEVKGPATASATASSPTVSKPARGGKLPPATASSPTESNPARGKREMKSPSSRGSPRKKHKIVHKRNGKDERRDDDAEMTGSGDGEGSGTREQESYMSDSDEE